MRSAGMRRRPPLNSSPRATHPSPGLAAVKACNRKTPLDKASWKIRAPGNRKRKSGNMIPDRGGFGDHGEGVHY